MHGETLKYAALFIICYIPNFTYLAPESYMLSLSNRKRKTIFTMLF